MESPITSPTSVTSTKDKATVTRATVSGVITVKAQHIQLVSVPFKKVLIIMHSFVFKADYIENTDTVVTDICDSISVDCGAPAHIITSKESFISMKDLSTEKHIIEPEDGSRPDNVVLDKGNASILAHDNNGVKHDSVPENALYIPSYKPNILSVQAAVRKGASVNFGPNNAQLIAPDGTTLIETLTEKLVSYLSWSIVI